MASHFVLLLLGVSGLWGTPMGDITYSYEPWATQMVSNNSLFGITSDWVYPWVDLLPVLVPKLIALATGYSYFAVWVAGSIVIDLVALWALIGFRGTATRARLLAGFAWVGLQFLLGPVAISRIDNLSIALAMIAIGAFLEGKDAIAAGWLAFATWVKIWPAAVLLALFAATKNLRKVLESSQVVLISIALLGFLFGRFHSISFFLAQSDRGIQIESPIALIWIWQKILGSATSGIYYDQTYLTFQVQGEQVETFASLMSQAFYAALGITAWLAIKASRQQGNRDQIFAWVSMTAILDMIVFNKVGSPQYIGWLFVPAIYAIAKSLAGWKPAIFSVAGISFLTFVIYPMVYDGILQSELLPTMVLTLRNLALIFLLVQANLELMKLGKQALDERAH
ncbi:MAG: glycosyltransferase 87 family protein [Micrococcales bacterium]